MKALFACAGLAGLLLTTTAQATALSLSPTPQSATLGNDVTLTLSISGLGSEIVSTFDLNVYFDASVLKAKSAVLNYPGANTAGGLGGDWMDLGTLQSDNFDLFAYSLTYDPQLSQTANDAALAALQDNDSFVIATLTFETVGAGVSQVWFGTGTNERDVVGLNATFLQNLQFGSACVAVNSATGGNNACTVPEPSSYALAGLALFGAFVPGALRRRREPQRG